MESKVRLLLVGYGRMGRLIETLSPEYGCEVVGHLDIDDNVGGTGLRPERWRDVDVAVDFSIAPAFLENVPRLVALGVDLVVGTTGWRDQEAAVRRRIADAGIGAVVAANFSIGVNLFEALVEQAGLLFAARPDYGAWVHEMHHAAKKDRPSGTALVLKAGLERAGYDRGVDVASTRAGSNPGIHSVGFDGPSETVTLTHLTRDRATFARGALQAARWVHGRQGWFTMRDVLGIRWPALTPRGGGKP